MQPLISFIVIWLRSYWFHPEHTHKKWAVGDFSYLLLLSVVSSIMPESLPFEELWELRANWCPRDLLSLSIPPSLSLSPESFPLEIPSISSEVGHLWSLDEPPDRDPSLGDEPPPPTLSWSLWVTLAPSWPLLQISCTFNPCESASGSFPLAPANRPRLLLLGIDLELS